MVMASVIIVNPKEFERKKQLFKSGGSSKLHVVSDFDRTLTVAFSNGEELPTAIAQIRKGNYISPEYAKKAYSLHDEYYPIEVNPNIQFSEKNAKMNEWWNKHLKLIVDSGLSKQIMKKIISDQRIVGRPGTDKFFEILNSNDVPVLILSAGLGDFIEEYIDGKGLLVSNVHIISNFFEFDNEGMAVGYKSKLIHSLNKDEAQVRGSKYFKKISDRTNVLLLGDSVEDIKMSAGMNHEEIIKVGFLNKNIDENIESFKKNFDVIILNDGPMDFVNELLEEIFGEK
jgi:5'-nucleotidase